MADTALPRMRCPNTELYELHLANLKAMAGPEHRQQRQTYIALTFAFSTRFIARWVRQDFQAWYAAIKATPDRGH